MTKTSCYFSIAISRATNHWTWRPIAGVRLIWAKILRKFLQSERISLWTSWMPIIWYSLAEKISKLESPRIVELLTSQPANGWIVCLIRLIFCLLLGRSTVPGYARRCSMFKVDTIRKGCGWIMWVW